MIHCCCAVIGDKHGCYTAKEIEHLDMSFNPVACFLIHVCFYKSILAVSQYPYKDPCLCDLSGVRIKDVGGITCPVNFNLFTRLSRDMHGSPAFLFILLDVVAELGIHERLFVAHTALLTVFYPEKLFVDSISQKFFANVVKVRHAFICC